MNTLIKLLMFVSIVLIDPLQGAKVASVGLVGYARTNSKIDTLKDCGNITDCFNCTLSNCKWGKNKCDYYPAIQRTAVIDVRSFFYYGDKCGDPLGLCYSDISYD